MKMAADWLRCINTLFTALCITIALIFTAYCIYQYCKNEDSSVVTFSEYHDEEDNIYPGITLCFLEYLKPGTLTWEEKKKFYNKVIEGRALFEKISQKKKYLKTLKYKKVSDDLTVEQEEQIKNVTEKLMNIFQDNVVLNIKDYLLFGFIRKNVAGMYVHEFLRNRSWRLDNLGFRFDQQRNETWIPIFYQSLSDIYRRCWTFEIPYNNTEQVQTFGVMLNRSIFGRRRIRPAYKNFEIRLSYPKQQLTAPTVKSNWGFRDPNSTKPEYTMNFEIQNMVVLKRRNKPNKGCTTKWKDNDKQIIDDIVDTTGCVLPHWNLNTTDTICVGPELRNISRILGNMKGYPLPCQSVEKFMYLYQEPDGLDFFQNTIGKATKGKYKGTKYDHTDAFQVQVSFQGPTYMEITQSRAYDAQSLVGNAGGYVGLFLGVALIQTPSAICVAARFLQKLIHKL